MEEKNEFTKDDIYYHFEKIIIFDAFQNNIAELKDAYDCYSFNGCNEELKSYWFDLFNNYFIKVAKNYVEENANPQVFDILINNFNSVVQDNYGTFEFCDGGINILKERLVDLYKVYFTKCIKISCFKNELSDKNTKILSIKMEQAIDNISDFFEENDCSYDESYINERWYALFKIYIEKQAELYAYETEELEEEINVVKEIIIDNFNFVLEDLDDAFRNCMYSNLIDVSAPYDLFKKYFIQSAKYYCYKKGLPNELFKLIIDEFNLKCKMFDCLGNYQEIMEEWDEIVGYAYEDCHDDSDDDSDDDNIDDEELPFE